jgi:erythromycin esterase
MVLLATLASALVFPFVVDEPRKEPSPKASREATEPAAVVWIRSNLTALSTDIPTEDEFEPLLKSLAASKVIGLGESTHGDHQSQEFKSQAIRRLISVQKLDTVVFEINRSAGQALDEYVNLGRGEFSDVIRNQGVFKIWQTDEFASLIGWMRGYVVKSGRQIRIYGIDCQLPAKDICLVAEFLKGVDQEASTSLSSAYPSLFEFDQKGKTFAAWLEAQGNGDYKKNVDPIRTAAKLLADKQGEWSKLPGYDEAAYAADTAYQAFNSFEFEFGDSTKNIVKMTPAYYSRRDKFMAQNLLKRVGDNRACLWAHDLHVLGEMPEQAKKVGFVTLGAELKKTLKSTYTTVGFTWSDGIIRVKTGAANDVSVAGAQKGEIPLVKVSSKQKGDLGEFFSRIGPDNFYVDFRKADRPTELWGKNAYYRASIGWIFDPKNFMADPTMDSITTIPSHDILVYNKRISPSRLWVYP